jgi:hypothetical protein
MGGKLYEAACCEGIKRAAIGHVKFSVEGTEDFQNGPPKTPKRTIPTAAKKRLNASKTSSGCRVATLPIGPLGVI